jgi:hypothetical protein
MDEDGKVPESLPAASPVSQPLPRSPFPYRSAKARHAASVLGVLLREAGALDCTDEEVAAATELCHALVDLDPDGRGIPTRRLYEYLGGRFPRAVLERRLAALMSAGAVEKHVDKLREQEVLLSMSGSLGLILVPEISTTFGQKALLERLSRVHARASSPEATAADVQADIIELRRVLTGFANSLRRIVDEGNVAAMLEQASEADDQEIRIRIGRLSKVIEDKFADELTGDLEDLAGAAHRYVRQQVRLLRQLGANRSITGHWLRSDEIHEILRSGSLARLASLWDGIVFDQAPYWLDPARIISAAENLTFEQGEQDIPEAGTHPLDEAEEPSLREVLADFAELLLSGKDEVDLTSMLLQGRWPDPIIMIARLSALAGLEIGYDLSYGQGLLIGSDGTKSRVVSVVKLQRIRESTVRRAAGSDVAEESSAHE